MAVAFDAVSPSATGNTGTAASATWAHTCGANATVLTVAVLVSATFGADTCTYGGTPLTLVDRIQSNANGGNTTGYIALFKLDNPPPGTANIVFTSHVSALLIWGATSFTGSAGIGIPQHNSTNGTASSLAVSIPATTSGGMVVGAACCGHTSFAQSNTVAWTRTVDTATGWDNAGEQYTPSNGGATSLTWTTGTADWFGAVAVELLPATATRPVTPQPGGKQFRKKWRRRQTPVPVWPIVGVQIDPSTPAVTTFANGTHTAITSATFSPPANSVILIVYDQEYNASGNTDPTLTPSSSGNTLSWTNGPSQWQASLNGKSAQFAAFNAAAQSNITVTVTPSLSYSGAAQMQVFVLTGVDTQSFIGGGSNKWTGSASTVENASITTTARGSRVFAGAVGISTGVWTPVGGISTYGTPFVDATAGNSCIVGVSDLTTVPGATTKGWTISPACLTNGTLWEIKPAVPAVLGTARAELPGVVASAADATVDVDVFAEVAIVGAVAPDQTVSTATSGTSANAGVASVGVVANALAPDIDANAVAAAVSSVANAPTTAVVITAGVAVVSAVANAPLAAPNATPVAAAVASVANATIQVVTFAAGVAVSSATVTSPVAKVNVVPVASAVAAVALATGSTHTVTSPVASVASTALLGAGSVTAVAGVAVTSAVASPPATAETVTSGVAVVNSVANQPGVTTSGSTNAIAGVATVSAVASPPAVATTLPPPPVPATVVANPPTIAVRVNAEVATVGGTANAPATPHTFTTGVAAVSSVATPSTTTVTVTSGVASVSSVANAASTVLKANSGVAIINATGNAATVSTVPSVNAPAGVATVGAVAPAPAPAIAPNPPPAIVTTTPPAPGPSVRVNAGVATVGGVAPQPVITTGVLVNAGVATVAASARPVLAGVGASPSAATAGAVALGGHATITFSAATAAVAALAGPVALPPTTITLHGLGAGGPEGRWGAGEPEDTWGTGSPYGSWGAGESGKRYSTGNPCGQWSSGEPQD